jgi:catechol 2,3-dioxygenase-like lactoylglutathione lyase family enzyme
VTSDRDFRIDHTGIGVADVAQAAAFYDVALGALGLRRVMQISMTGEVLEGEDAAGGIGYGESFPIYWIDVFHPHGVRQHTAFRARSRDEVDAFYAKALAAGGKDNGAPGTREGYPPGYYAAFVLDPDGNNIEAVFRA